jgi:hypothetical protein
MPVQRLNFLYVCFARDVEFAPVLSFLYTGFVSVCDSVNNF